MKIKLNKNLKIAIAYCFLIIGILGLIFPFIPGFVFLGVSVKLLPPESKILTYITPKLTTSLEYIKNIFLSKKI